MLKFADLSMAQKKCVVALIEADSTLTKTGKITLKEVSTITQALAAKRAQGATKIGYPNWLFKANKLEKGLYQLPLPTAKELSTYQQAVEAKASPVKAAKVKVAKLAKVKAIKAQRKTDVTNEDEDISGSRLTRIIAESEPYDADVEDFNAILRENGIEV